MKSYLTRKGMKRSREATGLELLSGYIASEDEEENESVSDSKLAKLTSQSQVSERFVHNKILNLNLDFGLEKRLDYFFVFDLGS